MDWQEIYDCTDLNKSYTLFLNQFLKMYNKRFPIRIIKDNKKKKGKPWITKGIIKSTIHKNKLYKRFLKKPSIKNEEIYKKYKNKLNHILTGHLTGCGKIWEIVRHFQVKLCGTKGQLCGKNGRLCGKLCDFSE